MEQGQVMHVTGLQVLGLQFIIAGIKILTSESIPLTSVSFEKRKSCLESCLEGLKNILNKAVTGHEILQKCRHGEIWSENLSLKEAADAERAFEEVNNLLLQKNIAAKTDDEKIALFQKIAGICERFFITGRCLDEDRKILYGFCIEASHRLDFVYQLLGGIPREVFIARRT